MSVLSESVRTDLREEIEALVSRYGLPEEAAETLERHVGLVDWAQGNFVPKQGPSSPARDARRARRFASNMLAESLSGLEVEPVHGARRLADIGSGAGFPGLVLAIALPQARVTLVEKVSEKCSFLRRATAELELENVEVVEGPVQEWSDGVGACDVVTSRKVGRVETMIEWSTPLLAPGGVIALWPGSKNFPEGALESAAGAVDAAGLRLAQVHALESEDNRGKRRLKHLYLYEKVGES
jgi:16S rRNA (guanine527-N7)-methyltransferase